MTVQINLAPKPARASRNQRRRKAVLSIIPALLLTSTVSSILAQEEGGKVRKTRAKPLISIAVKVYEGRPEKVSRTAEGSCVAWVPNSTQTFGGFMACSCGLGLNPPPEGTSCKGWPKLAIGQVRQ